MAWGRGQGIVGAPSGDVGAGTVVQKELTGAMERQAERGVTRRRATMTVVVLASLSAATAAAAQPPGQGGLPPALGRALQAYNAATVGNDAATLAALVSDDYVLVNSDASLQGKASYLADFARPGFKVDPYEVERPVYRVTNDAALTAGEIRLRWTQDGRQQSRRVRIAHFWVLQQGRWRIAYTQLTRLPD